MSRWALKRDHADHTEWYVQQGPRDALDELPIYILRADRDARMSTPPARRRLAFYSICHVKEGECWYWSTYRSRPFRAEVGQVILTSPGVLHSYGHEDHACREDYVAFVGPVADQLNTLGVFNARRPVVTIPDPARIEHIAELIGGASASVEDQLRAGMLLQLVLFDAHFRGGGDQDADVALLDQLLIRLEEHPDVHLSNDEMAHMCNMSESHFRRRFRDKVGMTPCAYSERVRMDRARNLLEATSKSITDVAQTMGYVDPLYFSKRFMKIVGMSPRAYRNSVTGPKAF